MDVKTALRERRTIRKFTKQPIPRQDLIDLVDYARLAAYPGNNQSLRFAIIDEKALVDAVFVNTKWAGYLADGTPKDDERPTAFIAVLGDNSIKKTFEVEAGAAVTSMMLGAFDKGIASCWIGSLNRTEVMNVLGISKEKYSLVYVLALGYPAQKSRVCQMQDGDIKYFLDEENVLNVPKHSLDEVIIDIKP